MRTALAIATEIVDANMAADEWSREKFILDIERALVQHREGYVKAERELCAEIAETTWITAQDTEFDSGAEHARQQIARAIRARNNEARS